MAKVINYDLKTKEFDLLNQETPLIEYPNKQFERESYYSLNGKWDVRISDIDSLEGEFKEKIFVLTGFSGDEQEKLTELITSKGGEVKSSTVVDTDYLIVMEDYEHETSKYKRALELKEKGKELFVVGAKRFYELTKV